MSESDRAQAPLVGIGALLRQLQPEFPRLSASKVRFLEDQGLIRPQRTPSGYRKYSDEDIERLETILRLQQERYLPLKAIRDRLERGDDLRTVAQELEPRVSEHAPSSVPEDHAQATPRATSLTGQRYTLREVASRTGTDTALLRELVNNGWLVEDQGTYDDFALTVATSANRLRSYGIEPRHLRALRGASERVVGWVESAVSPLVNRKDPSSREEAPQRAREIASLCLTMITALTNAQLTRTLRPFEKEQ